MQFMITVCDKCHKPLSKGYWNDEKTLEDKIKQMFYDLIFMDLEPEVVEVCYDKEAIYRDIKLCLN